MLSKYGPMILERLHIHGGLLNAQENLAQGGADASPLQDPRLLLALREELRLEVEHLHAGQSFHGIEWYMPYAYDQPASLLDYVARGRTLVVDDALDLFATLHELEQQAERLRLELERTGELPRNFAAQLLHRGGAARRLADAAARCCWDTATSTAKPASANTPLARAFVPGPRFGGKTKEIATDVVKLHTAGHTHRPGHPPGGASPRAAARGRIWTPSFSEMLQAPPLPASVNVVHGVLGEGFILRGLGERHGRTEHAPRTTPSTFHRRRTLWLEQAARPAPRPKAHSTVAPEIFFADMKPGEFVVHIEHGIGCFDGLVRMELAGIEREYLQVSYARGDKLYVPVHQADRLSRYVGAGENTPPVNRLGTADWQQVKERRQARRRRDRRRPAQALRRARDDPGLCLQPGRPLAGRDGGRLPLPGDRRPTARHRGRQARHGVGHGPWTA